MLDLIISSQLWPLLKWVVSLKASEVVTKSNKNKQKEAKSCKFFLFMS